MVNYSRQFINSYESEKKMIGEGTSFDFQVIQVNNYIEQLPEQELINEYRKSRNRLIVIDCEEVVFQLERHLKKLEIDTMIIEESKNNEILNYLMKMNKSANIFLVSSKSSSFYKDIQCLERLNVFAEHGVYFKEEQKNKYECLIEID